MPEETTTPGLVELTRQAYEAASRRDLDGVMSFFAPEAVLDVEGLGIFEGRAAVREFYKDWFGSYEDYAVEAPEIADLGNGVGLAMIIIKGRPGDFSTELRLRYAAVHVFAEGFARARYQLHRHRRGPRCRGTAR
jgi:ketosteroid isomerase-like protein